LDGPASLLRHPPLQVSDHGQTNPEKGDQSNRPNESSLDIGAQGSRAARPTPKPPCKDEQTHAQNGRRNAVSNPRPTQIVLSRIAGNHQHHSGSRIETKTPQSFGDCAKYSRPNSVVHRTPHTALHRRRTNWGLAHPFINSQKWGMRRKSKSPPSGSQNPHPPAEGAGRVGQPRE